MVTKATGACPDSSRPAVELESLVVSYNSKGPSAVSDVEFRANFGEMVLLMGPNGGGKTTLLRVIAGLLRPLKGRVSVLGRDPYVELSVRRLIAYIPQIKELNIYAPLTVKDLVSFGRYPHTRPLRRLSKLDEEIVERAIAAVNLQSEKDKKLSELSGGQLNRAMIARALVQEPLIYLLDEPFESIDNPSETMVIDVLKKERNRGKLVIISEHHISEPEEFDRVVLINRRVIAEGSPHVVLIEENLKTVFNAHITLNVKK